MKKKDITGWTSFGSSEEKKITEPSSFNYIPDIWLLVVNEVDRGSSTNIEILQKVHFTTQEEINFEIHFEHSFGLHLYGSPVDLPLGKPSYCGKKIEDTLYHLCVDTYGETVDCNSMVAVDLPGISQDLGIFRQFLSIKKVNKEIISTIPPFPTLADIESTGEVLFNRGLIVTATGNPLKVNISII